MDDSTLAGYAAAQTGAAVYSIPDPGYVRIGGADRADYIQRQTTNDVRLLQPGRTLLTVLTSGTARILDVWRLIAEPDAGPIAAITLPGRGAITARYLQSRIFFKDKVTVVDGSAAWTQFEIVGPAAGHILGGLPEPDQITAAEFDGVALRLIGLRPNAAWVIAPAEQGDRLAARLVEAGAARLNAAVYEALRIEGGRPGPARELTDDYTPLEANLDAAVSSTKGCYSGQEIIARQITYDKVARRLIGLRVEGMGMVGAAVQVEGRTVGVVTSAAESPRHGPIALAVLRRPHCEPQTYVTVVGENGAPVKGQTVALPFGE
jgi:folate-binding protein YgfZ